MVDVLLAFLGVLFLGILLLHVVVLPWIVRDRLGAILRAQKLEPFSFRVPIAGFGQALVTNLKFGEGETRVERMVCKYSISSLREGRLDSIRVDKMHIIATVTKEGRLDLGPLSPLLEPSGEKKPPPHPSPSEPVALPAPRIELLDSTLILKLKDHDLELPHSGSIVSTDGGKTYSIQFQTELGSPLVLEGTFAPATAALQLKINARKLNREKLNDLVAAFAPQAGVGVASPLRVSGELSRDSKKLHFSATVEATAATTQPVETGPNLQLTGGVFHVVTEISDHLLMRVGVTNASLSERSQDGTVSGITGELALTSFSPLKSEPNQRVAVREVKMGEVALTDGIVQFQLTSSDTLAIQHTQWNVMGGKVVANDAAISGSDVNVVLQAQQVDLKQLLDKFGQGKATGEGSLSGQIQVSYTNGQIHLSSGELRASGDGILRIQQAEDIAKEVAATTVTKNPSAQQQVRDQILEALRNFQYNVLAADLKRGPDGLTGFVRISGRGRTGAKLPIDYDLTVRGLDPLIRSVLKLREATSGGHNAQGKAQP